MESYGQGLHQLNRGKYFAHVTTHISVVVIFVVRIQGGVSD